MGIQQQQSQRGDVSYSPSSPSVELQRSSSSFRETPRNSSSLSLKSKKKKKKKKKESLSQAGVAFFEQRKDMFKIDWKKVILTKEIGSGGGNATIFLGSWSGQKIAFKVFRVTDLSESEDFDDFERELKVSSSISHPNILRFFGCSLSIPRVGIVMEYCKNGDLSYWMKKTLKNGVPIHIYRKVKLTKKISNRILHGVGSGMLYLHSRDIIHRDLKGQNVLMTKELVAKLCDFGLSKIIERSERFHMTKRVGTSWYIAPEVILGDNYDEKCDVFSFSMVMFELLFENSRPFGTETIAIENKIANSENFRPEIPDEHGIPSWLIGIMVQCWKHDPLDRPSFEEIHKKISSGLSEMKKSGQNDQMKKLEKRYKKMMSNDDEEESESEEESEEERLPPRPQQQSQPVTYHQQRRPAQTQPQHVRYVSSPGVIAQQQPQQPQQQSQHVRYVSYQRNPQVQPQVQYMVVQSPVSAPTNLPFQQPQQAQAQVQRQNPQQQPVQYMMMAPVSQGNTTVTNTSN